VAQVDEYDQRWLDHVFMYHPPEDDQAVRRYQAIREQGRLFALMIMELCPDTGDRSTAVLKIREAVMWANAAIACKMAREQ